MSLVKHCMLYMIDLGIEIERQYWFSIKRDYFWNIIELILIFYDDFSVKRLDGWFLLYIFKFYFFTNVVHCKRLHMKYFMLQKNDKGVGVFKIYGNVEEYIIYTGRCLLAEIINWRIHKKVSVQSKYLTLSLIYLCGDEVFIFDIPLLFKLN